MSKLANLTSMLEKQFLLNLYADKDPQFEDPYRYSFLIQDASNALKIIIKFFRTHDIQIGLPLHSLENKAS